MGKRSLSTFVLVTLVAGFIAILAPAASALTSVESCFYNYINSERVAVGRPKLALKSDLVTIARNHSKKMAADGTIYHNNNLGNEISGNWYAAGENVGMGPDCKSVHDAFMASPGHKANILDTDCEAHHYHHHDPADYGRADAPRCGRREAQAEAQAEASRARSGGADDGRDARQARRHGRAPDGSRDRRGARHLENF